MRSFFHLWYHSWKNLLAERKFRWSLVGGVLVFLLALYVNFRATLYTDQITVLSVGDLILDHIPTVDMSFVYTFGVYFVAAIVTLYPIFFKPELFPFTLKTISVFYIVRSVFITLTHLGAPANYFKLAQFEDQPGIFKLFYTNDLFFSGHTGFPFLGALLFWENKTMRYFLLFMSILQGATVLLMHVHYSIDVFAAFFITYTIYILSDRLFNPLTSLFRKIVLSIKDRRLRKVI